ncbi:MAG: hypothetical protein KDE35_06130 [Geminicoccaceae bacterium]|nr:hypothetical protein [Geminicoccaceae bacterium]
MARTVERTLDAEGGRLREKASIGRITTVVPGQGLPPGTHLGEAASQESFVVGRIPV